MGVITIHLNTNLETCDRHVERGALILKAFHAERASDPGGSRAEFLRGEFSGWRADTHGIPRLCRRNGGPRSRKNVLTHPREFPLRRSISQYLVLLAMK